MLVIKRATNNDFDCIWPILHEVFSKGDTYAFSPETTKEEAFALWMEKPKATYIALLDNDVVGTYFIKENQPGLGSHICNAGYIVTQKVRGKGIARKMCEHSIKEALSMGFMGMQYNLVVSTNEVAVQLWQKCGFKIAGTLDKAFNHKEKGLVDAYVMYQWFDTREDLP